MAKTQLNISVDDKVKEEAKLMYESMGLNLNTAINMFLIKSIQVQKLPFTPKAENLDSIQARFEATYLQDKLPSFDNINDFWDDLNAN